MSSDSLLVLSGTESLSPLSRCQTSRGLSAPKDKGAKTRQERQGSLAVQHGMNQRPGAP